MTKLILTTSDSGAGHLKQEGVARRVIALTPRLVWGEVPRVEDEADFPAMRSRLAERPNEGWAYWDEWTRMNEAAAENGTSDPEVDPTPLRSVWAELPRLCADYPSIELWIDPTPNAQLVMLQLLSWFGQDPALVGKLALVHADTPLGARAANGRAHLEPRDAVRSGHLELAARAWDAFRRPTPEAWLQLLREDLSVLPHLRQTVREWLEELPDAVTALGATEATMLALIGSGAPHPFDVFPGHKKANTRRMFEYWETGMMLERLASGPEPVVLGLDEGPFTLPMHQDPARFDRYRGSRLSLSDLGRRLVERCDDLSRHADVSRWWGGVKLTNNNLWRWDAGAGRLVAPG